jgi:Ca-activated chloride channel family protein
MSFIWPVMLILLLLVPLFVALYVRLQRRRRRFAASFGSLGLVQAAAGMGQRRRPGARRHIPPALFLIGLTILLIALARPQTVVSLPRVEGTVILTFDVSGSMAADDLKPTRMEAAKAAARDFVQRQPRTVQIGVVAFSDSGLAVQAPTNDQDTILAAINRLTPQRGTSLGQGILASLNTIAAASVQAPRLYSNLTPTPQLTPTPVPKGTDTSAAIVLLTDGENNENPNPLSAAQAAADRGVRIYTVGIGS